MTKHNFFFSYVGGKGKDMPHIKKYIPNSGIKLIAEAFCGSGAFSRSIYYDNDNNVSMKYHLNDIDTHLIKFYKNIKLNKLSSYIEYFNDNIPKYYDEDVNKPTEKWRKLSRERNKIKINNNMLWYLYKRACSRGCLLDYGRVKKGYNVSDFDDCIKFYTEKEIKYTNYDYMKIIELYKNNKSALIFLDPPYFSSFNSSYNGYYPSETENKIIIDNTEMYINILEALRTAKCKIMLIINSNHITRFIYKDYIRGSYGKRYDISGRTCEHIVCCNYNIE